MLGAWAIFPVVAPGQSPPPVNFSRDILPILSDHCFQCHGPDEQGRQAELRLDTLAGSRGKGESGEFAVVPGAPEKSELVRRITASDPSERMPPQSINRNLSPAQIDLLQRWVREGAPWGKHWAYETPQRPAIPADQAGKEARNPLDAFVLQRLHREGLSPAPEAPKHTLLRRVSLDLIGLPPTPTELSAFQNDPSPDAFERQVDRLLASPRYGERWAWDWLDAARYADTNGFQGDPERTMWPWRDWVVRALNANMPYDQFSIDQLAGDLLTNATKDQRLASGFHRNNMHNGEGGRIAEETRVENIFDRVETTATVWMGLTFTCCRCHDHKFDPLTLRDYFGLYDIFNQMSETGAGRGGQAEPVLDYSTPFELERIDKAQQRIDSAAQRAFEFELVKFPRPEGKPLTESAAQMLPGNLPGYIAAKEPKARSIDGLLEAIGYFQGDGKDPAYVKVLQELLAAFRERDAARTAVTKVMIMDQLPKPRETFILVKGAYDKPTKDSVLGAMPAVLTAPVSNSSPDGAASPPQRAGRLELARWLVSPQNPLAARVTVNRSWQSLFGVGLVKTSEDFGLQGEMPSHPELLDWLAVEFVDSGWNVKRLHRTLVTSGAYRQSSHWSAATAERDPENRLLARGPRHRMPAWMLRDAALAAGGLLGDALGGPSVKPYQPDGIWEEATFGKKTYVRDKGAKLYRRSLYVYWRRIVGPTMFFDVAARQTCTVKPSLTNTPLHALVTLNDITYVEAARAMAQRVMQSESDPAARIALAFEIAVSRKPTQREAEILAARLAKLSAQYAADLPAAEKLLAVGDSPRDAKLSPAEHAAYTGLCSLILNLDEALSKE